MKDNDKTLLMELAIYAGYLLAAGLVFMLGWSILYQMGVVT